MKREDFVSGRVSKNQRMDKERWARILKEVKSNRDSTVAGLTRTWQRVLKKESKRRLKVKSPKPKG